MKRIIFIIIILAAAIAGYLILSKKPAQKPASDTSDTKKTETPDFDGNDYLNDAIIDLEEAESLN